MDCITKNIAMNLRKIRNTRHLSLDEVAEQTGVSKSMLGQIERGEANPTVGSLMKISSGLRIDLFDLMTQPANYAVVIDQTKLKAIKKEEGSYEIYQYFAYDKKRALEVCKVCLQPGAEYTGENHGEGSKAYVTVLNGTLTCVVEAQQYEVTQGNAISFEADSDYKYVNASSLPVEIMVTMSYLN